jgi:hypothetical protein
MSPAEEYDFIVVGAGGPKLAVRTGALAGGAIDSPLLL